MAEKPVFPSLHWTCIQQYSTPLYDAFEAFDFAVPVNPEDVVAVSVPAIELLMFKEVIVLTLTPLSNGNDGHGSDDDCMVVVVEADFVVVGAEDSFVMYCCVLDVGPVAENPVIPLDHWTCIQQYSAPESPAFTGVADVTFPVSP